MSYATVAQIKAYLGITSASSDVLLGDLIDRAQSAVDQYTHRHFEATTETRYFLRESLLDSYTLLVDQDLLTITGVVNGDSDETAIPITEFFYHPRNLSPYFGITLKTDSTYSWEWDTDYWVAITGTWGYSATPPDDIVHATIRLTAYFYRQKDAQVFDVTAQPAQGTILIPQGLPKDVKLLLDVYTRTMRMVF